MRLRADQLLIDRGLVETRARAQALILAGKVFSGERRIDKAGQAVAPDTALEVRGLDHPWVSRGGLKLHHALTHFRLSPHDRICLDVGASTGGFTDCLLQRGASKVYAVDVTIDQLDWKLRKDSRVITLERNARYLAPKDIAESPDFVTMDVSFISVDKVLPAVVPLAAAGAEFLILIKPQFELEKREVGKGGIVRDAALHQKAIDRVKAAAAQAGLEIIGVQPSRLPGAEGNQEFFLHARKRA
jgi:23S rRNA (cytidine1920-2'-O)/16S rRNA (cytidine1409-2'-O)-methyltransferase